MDEAQEQVMRFSCHSGFSSPFIFGSSIPDQNRAELWNILSTVTGVNCSCDRNREIATRMAEFAFPRPGQTVCGASTGDDVNIDSHPKHDRLRVYRNRPTRNGIANRVYSKRMGRGIGFLRVSPFGNLRKPPFPSCSAEAFRIESLSIIASLCSEPKQPTAALEFGPRNTRPPRSRPTGQGVLREALTEDRI
jgi:hypothetical protein